MENAKKFLFLLGLLGIYVGLSSCFSMRQAHDNPPIIPESYSNVTSKGVKIAPKDSFRVAFYNVENLFDTLDDPMKQDSEFLPNAQTRWTSERYWAKQKNLAKVVEALGYPSVMGMVEVENRAVLQDLVAQPGLKANNYDIVHFESPDERGIDVAMIYKKSDFTVKNAKPHRIDLPDSPDKTRDILEVSGILRGEPVTFFVNHWPSRRGGADESDPKRIHVGQSLRKAVDSIFQSSPNARIVIMGDLNDEPNDASLLKGLKAEYWNRDSLKTARNGQLYNLAAGVQRKGEGSYFYRGKWETIDQIIVSGAFLVPNAVMGTPDEESVFKADFLTFTDRSGAKVPSRTYTGPVYRGGFSDHFPIYINVYLR